MRAKWRQNNKRYCINLLFLFFFVWFTFRPFTIIILIMLTYELVFESHHGHSLEMYFVLNGRATRNTEFFHSHETPLAVIFKIFNKHKSIIDMEDSIEENGQKLKTPLLFNWQFSFLIWYHHHLILISFLYLFNIINKWNWVKKRSVELLRALIIRRHAESLQFECFTVIHFCIYLNIMRLLFSFMIRCENLISSLRLIFFNKIVCNIFQWKNFL